MAKKEDDDKKNEDGKNPKKQIKEIEKSINDITSKKNEIIESRNEFLKKETKSLDEYIKELNKSLVELFGETVVEGGKTVTKDGLVNELFESMMKDEKDSFDVIIEHPEDFEKLEDEKDKNVLINFDGEINKDNLFDGYQGIVNFVKGNIISDYVFEEQSGIVNMNGEINGQNAFKEQNGIVNVNGEGVIGGYYAFYKQSGIVNVNGGKIYGDKAFMRQSGIVNMNGGEISGINVFLGQSGIVNINGGKIGNYWAFEDQSGIVNINGGKIYDLGVFLDQSGIVNINGGEIGGTIAFASQSGIVNINGGEIGGDGIFNYQSGFVRISKDAEFDSNIADNMTNGLLYVMNNDVEIGAENNEGNLNDTHRLRDGLVIAPNGARRIYNDNAVVFTVENNESKYYGNVVTFVGGTEIDNEKYDASDILKELGDYVWDTTVKKFKGDGEEKEAHEFVNEVAEKFKGKTTELNVSELLKGYSREKTIGESVYDRLKNYKV